MTARTGIKVLAGGINAIGVVTATGGFNLGISSGGNSVVSGSQNFKPLVLVIHFYTMHLLIQSILVSLVVLVPVVRLHQMQLVFIQQKF